MFQTVLILNINNFVLLSVIIRGPFGRHAWTMQLRHLPRSKSVNKYHAPNPGRPIPMNDTPQRNDVEQKFFPECVDRVIPCVADYSIPTLEEVKEKIGTDALKRLSDLLENQTIHEKLAWAETESSVNSLSHSQESMPPSICHEFQAARLFLSHFGFLTLDDNAHSKTPDVPSISPLLTVLDTTKDGFASELEQLDKMSPRTCDTVHIFYVKTGQTTDNEIISNLEELNVHTLDPSFWNMVYSLGWPVKINEHSGWTGFINSSWNLNQRCSSIDSGIKIDADTCNFNGEKQVIYWADVGSEIAFVIPTKWNRMDETDGGLLSTESLAGHPSYERSVSELPTEIKPGQVSATTSKISLGQKPRTLSLDFDKKDPIPPSRRRTGATKSHLQFQSSTKIMIVWLECYEDHLTFPTDELLQYTKTGEEFATGQYPRSSDTHIVFLHALTSGLIRVKLHAPSGRMNFATPLVDGMVMSRRVIGHIVRQTAHNMAKRRRLDNDVYQPPHVRRRLKVQELAQKYKNDMSAPQLLANLFKNS